MNEEHNLEAKRIYEKLISEKDQLIGKITLSLGGLKIRVREADSVGNLLQEWFGAWAQENQFRIEPQADTQVFPDFYVGDEKAYLEVKAWRKENSPAFDIANFDSYCESILVTPERIYADYLIFSYEIDDDGNLSIKDVYLKKIWEITTESGERPLKVQVKRDIFYNIRPANWVSERAQYKPFSNKDEFIKALFDTKSQYSSVDKRDEFIDALQDYNRRTSSTE
ncbi:MAG: NgoBV family restriction endonuclease [Candidatus Thalassarchaeaceae archaeon]